MARYTCSLTVVLSEQTIHSALIDIFQSCRFELIYDTDDYIMGREIPGDVSFAKLVTVEGLIDKGLGLSQKAHVSLVIKNEELPLQANNHCRQMFDNLCQAIADNPIWQVEQLVSC
ncbi:hypothetical protein [Prochlorothrix hollandica]|uniref:hypothetical protein n=1 Tax=Prochlorothrix hollandica TaxID=1223 RepID=UPI003342177A